MINSIFAKQHGYIDIHGGGFDLKFPHHENEMAQAKAHNGNKLARYWIHNGFININDEKMSKSLGNVVLMKDVVKEYGGLPFRLMVLASHYRAPASFSAETITEASKKWSQLEISARKAAISLQLAGQKIDRLIPKEDSKVVDALCDDLNSPNALAALYEENKNLNNALRSHPLDVELLKEAYARVRSGEEVLGLLPSVPSLTEEDKTLYSSYNEAKANKDFAKSDALRAKLIEKGIF